MTATLYAMDQRNSASQSSFGAPAEKPLECIEVCLTSQPQYAVIWMHGLGADGHDFESLVPLLGLPPDSGIRFVFPHAMMRPITVNGGAVMRAWYDVIEISASKGQDEAGIKHSSIKINQLIRREIERGIAADKIILAGFSQGGAMALYAGLRYPQKLAGIMALSAYLLFPERLQYEHSAANENTSVFLAHGSHDPMVPFPLGVAAKTALEAGQWPVEWHDYPIPHSVSQPEIADIGRWLQKRLV